MRLPLNEYFNSLDRDFINLSKINDDVFTYNATDVLVQSSWELPIVIQCPGSTVEFEFCSNPTDISFGIVFVAAPEEGQNENDLEIETVEEMSRVFCEVEPISGSFEVPCEGVVFFMWDNNYDWSANKQISYSIQVKQPTFSYMDKLRVDESVQNLSKVVEDLQMSQIKWSDATDCIEHNSENVNFLEDQLSLLEAKLLQKKIEYHKLEDDMQRLESKIDLKDEITPGLCIRLLNKHLLTEVFSFLDLSNIQEVCRYWSIICKEISSTSIIKLDKTTKVNLKKPKSEIKTELAQIYILKKLREQDYLQKLEASSTNLNSLITDKKSYNPVTNATNTTNAISAEASPTKEREESLNHIINAYHHNNSNDTKEHAAADSDSDISIDDEDTKYCDLFSSNTLLKKHFKANKSKSKTTTAISTSNKVSSDSTKPSNIHISYDSMLHANNINNKQDIFTTKITPSLPSPPMKLKQSNAITSTTAALEQQPSSSHNTKAMNYIATTKNLPIQVYDSNTQQQQQQQQQLGMNKSSKHKSKEIIPSDHEVDLPIVAESKRKLRAQHTSNSFTKPKVTKTEESKPNTTIINNNSSNHNNTANNNNNNNNNNKVSSKRKTEEETHKNLLQHVKNIRSEKQLHQMLDYFQGELLRIEKLTSEKRRIKKYIKAWNTSFEKKNHRLPTNTERKGHLRELYEEYHQAVLGLRIRIEKMDHMLTSVGLNKDSLKKLMEQKLISL